MALLNESIQKQIRQAFEPLEAPVKLVMFTQANDGSTSIECSMCSDTRQLLEEIAALSDKITLEVHDFVKEEALAKQYQVDKIPALLVQSGPEYKDNGIRLYGIPSGYEFGTLIEDILMTSQGKAMLSDRTRQEIQKLDKPVHIQVYTTPTWPYCPRAVLLAHMLALSSDLITADMVEAMEFPTLANKYQVYGVPRTVINEVIHIEGAVPEDMLIEQLMTVMDEKKMEKLHKQWKF